MGGVHLLFFLLIFQYITSPNCMFHPWKMETTTGCLIHTTNNACTRFERVIFIAHCVHMLMRIFIFTCMRTHMFTYTNVYMYIYTCCTHLFTRLVLSESWKKVKQRKRRKRSYSLGSIARKSALPDFS